jgi:hypothetical protein
LKERKKTTRKPKPYQPFSKIIDAFAMDEVQILQSSAGRESICTQVPLYL